MKGLLREWKKFLSEQASYQGILKTSLPPQVVSDLEAIQSFLPEEAIRLSSDDFHITLIHQNVLNPFKDRLKEIELPEPPVPQIDDEALLRQSPGKKSWAVRIVNQDEFKDYVAQVMELLGSENTNPEPERVFHISLANLTGNPYDSVR
jgi:hypothetical protein